MSAFDIIGDVHGCAGELEALLRKLGYSIVWHEEAETRQVSVTPPAGRQAVFLGDFVNRGPRTPDALRIAMHMTAAGSACAAQGNHDWKLIRWLDGEIPISPDLQQSADQLGAAGEAFKAEARRFLGALRSQIVLDEGRLAVAHAGLMESMIGQGSEAIRRFTLFGNAEGPRDGWAADYRGNTAIVYGHVPRQEARWLNNTLCIDTGCVYGGKLTALRWPEKEIVSVPALKAYASHKKFTAAG